MTHDYRLARERMVKTQLTPRKIKAKGVLQAMGKIPRHLFVEEALVGEAYNDHPLPIGHQQTISQPYIVALMTQALQLTGKEKTLEIGTGSGYQTAVLARLAGRVCTLERLEQLSASAQRTLEKLGIDNVEFAVGDGSCGWPEGGLFNRIIVTAAVPRFPEPLLAQLAEAGRIVAPIGGGNVQQLVAAEKYRGKLVERTICSCRFVKLIGAHGFSE